MAGLMSRKKLLDMYMLKLQASEDVSSVDIGCSTDDSEHIKSPSFKIQIL